MWKNSKISNLSHFVKLRNFLTKKYFNCIFGVFMVCLVESVSFSYIACHLGRWLVTRSRPSNRCLLMTIRWQRHLSPRLSWWWRLSAGFGITVAKTTNDRFIGRATSANVMIERSRADVEQAAIVNLKICPPKIVVLERYSIWYVHFLIIKLERGWHSTRSFNQLGLVLSVGLLSVSNFVLKWKIKSFLWVSCS